MGQTERRLLVNWLEWLAPQFLVLLRLLGLLVLFLVLLLVLIVWRNRSAFSRGRRAGTRDPRKPDDKSEPSDGPEGRFLPGNPGGPN